MNLAYNNGATIGDSIHHLFNMHSALYSHQDGARILHIYLELPGMKRTLAGDHIFSRLA